MIENEEFSSWFKENTPKEGLSENTTFTRQFLIDAWNNGYINGYNKANEWHYPSKGEYPKENQEVFVFFTLPDKSKNDIITAQFKDNDFNYVDLQDVIAWKEIILPKE